MFSKYEHISHNKIHEIDKCIMVLDILIRPHNTGYPVYVFHFSGPSLKTWEILAGLIQY